jgi:cell division protein FtsN
MGNRYIYKSNASRKSSNRTKKTGDNLTNLSTVSYENNQSKDYMIMFIRVIIFFVIILVVIIGGYFAGQYFYIQKIKPQNISQTSLIAPLISEKKNIDYNTNNPTSNEYVLIPKLNDKKTANKETNLKQNEKTITTNTLTTNSNEINTNKTETKEDQKILENLKSVENTKTIESSLKDTKENMNSTEANNEKNNLNKDIKDKENQNNTNNNILPDSEGSYYIQVGLFSIYNNAKYVSETLKNKGIYCSIDEIIIKNTKMYRVIVGPFKNMDKANEISKIIENEGFNPLVRKF